MENEKDEVIDSQDDTQTETVETNDEVQLTVDDYNKLAKEKADLEERNKKLYARLKKVETSKPLEKVSSQKESPELSQELTKIKLKLDYGIKDPDAIDFIMKNGGEEALKNPFIKQTIDNMLTQKASEAAQVAEESQKTDFERKTTNEQLKAMSSEELEKVLPHA